MSPKRMPRWRRRIPLIAGATLLLWGAAGIRQIDPGVEFGVVDGPVSGVFPRRTDRSILVAPPGLLRLSRYPRGAIELELPGAEAVRLAGPDGGRYGLVGYATLRVREEDWRQVHDASVGRGLVGALEAAVRSSGVPLPSPWRRGGPAPPTVARRIESGLRAALDERGIRLDRLEGLRFDFLESPLKEARPLPDSRVLVIGLDGADWEILDPLLEQERLPNLKRLIDNGARAKLLSVSPMLSPVIWTTVATGVEPSRHGIYDFLVPDPAGGRGQPVTSAQRRAAALWEILSTAGVGVGVVGWWATWPAEPVNGYLVSDRIAYQLFGYRSDEASEEGKVWPPDLYEDVRSALVAPDQVTWSDVRPYLTGTRSRPEQFDEEETELLEDFRTLLASGETYRDVALRLRQRLDSEFEAVYFEGTDTVGHLFMPYRSPRLAGVTTARYESFREVVDRYYETADGYLGRLLEGRGEDWTVVVLSDHGFVTDAKRPLRTDSRIGHGPAADWHRRFGVLVLSGARVRSGIRLDEATVYDVAPTILALFGMPVPVSWPGQVLAAALDPEFLDLHPVRFARDEPPRGELLAAAGDDPAAADLLEKLESLGYVGSSAEVETSLTTRNNAGVALMGEGRYAVAETEFRAALEQQPGHPMVTVNLALTLKALGRTEEAQQLFRQALDYPAARRAAGHQLGQLCMESGDLDCAESELRQVLRWEPGAAEVRATLGLVLEERGDREAAAREYRRAAELDRNAAIPRNNLGNLAKWAGRLDEAADWYREAIEADPYFMGAYNNLALVHQEQGRIDECIELYSRALEKSPGNAVVLNNLASVHHATGNIDEAVRLWRQAARSEPTYASPLNNLAGVAISDGQYEEAERLLRQALELDPDYGDARINLALVHRAAGRSGEARRELERATGDPAARVQALAHLGLLELEQGRPAEAVQRLEEAREGPGGGGVTVLNGLGEAYRRLGRTAEAVDAWRESLGVEPNQPDLRRSLDLLQSR